MFRIAILGSLTAVLTIGCGSVTANNGGKGGTSGIAGAGGTSGAAGTSGTAGTSGAGGSSGTGGGTTGGRGGADGVGGASGASGGTGGAAGDCTGTLALTGAFVGETAVANNVVPAAIGGAIADGTYDLTKIEDYPPMQPGTTSMKETIRVTGNLLERVNMASTAPGPTYYRYTTTTSGTQWTWTYVCPQTA